MYTDKKYRDWYSEEEEEETIYSKRGRESRRDADAMSDEEDGFMQGIEEDFESIFDDEIFDDTFEEVV
ncbi:TPA: hypothetical protein HA234_00255 [Candidatus Woesearchaeota archaeon]|nr:hypothetical protein [Candidatus Woesearchaeota archaeon]HIG92610.1 hypothetical protein [Candidatus Woesearchaeota archaeon]